jgi:hypothetical protein
MPALQTILRSAAIGRPGVAPNLRRHLTPTQVSLAAALMERLVDEAKERQREPAARGNKTRHGKEPPVQE